MSMFFPAKSHRNTRLSSGWLDALQMWIDVKAKLGALSDSDRAFIKQQLDASAIWMMSDGDRLPLLFKDRRERLVPLILIRLRITKLVANTLTQMEELSDQDRGRIQADLTDVEGMLADLL